MLNVLKKELEQMLQDGLEEFSDMSLKELCIKDKEISKLKISNCDFDKVEIINCKIHDLTIENSSFQNCRFTDVELHGEDAHLCMEKVSFQDCLFQEVSMDSFVKKSRIDTVKVCNTKLIKVHLYSDIEINSSTYENCDMSYVDFKGDIIRKCRFDKINGNECSIQSKFSYNSFNRMDVDDYHVKVDMLEV